MGEAPEAGRPPGLQLGKERGLVGEIEAGAELAEGHASLGTALAETIDVCLKRSTTVWRSRSEMRTGGAPPYPAAPSEAYPVQVEDAFVVAQSGQGLVGRRLTRR